MLDLGRGADAAIGVSNVFITHAHLDHAAGIAFYAGQRQLHRMTGGRVWVPAEAADGFREILRVWERLTSTRFPPTSPNEPTSGSPRIYRRPATRAARSTRRQE